MHFYDDHFISMLSDAAIISIFIMSNLYVCVQIAGQLIKMASDLEFHASPLNFVLPLWLLGIPNP